MKWHEIPERGSLLGMRIVLTTARLGGYLPGFLLTMAVVVFHWAVNARSRRASALYLARVGILPEKAGWCIRARATLRHHAAFAISLYDRLWLWMGRDDLFTIERFGQEAVLSLQGKGALLVGAHIGSFDLLRVISEKSTAEVHAVMHSPASARFMRLLTGIAPAAKASALLLDGSIEKVFELQSFLERGDLIALMADRRPPFPSREPSVSIPFLGRPAPFPPQVWRLAAALKAPVLWTWAVRTGWRRYEAHAVVFAEQVNIPRARRDEATREILTRFAGALEELCRAHPYQWFNFFDFWSET